MKRFFIDYIYYQEFQIRTIMRYHCTPIKRAKQLKPKQNPAGTKC